MALINCPECGERVSDHAKKCIYCGYPLKKGKGKWLVLLFAVVAVVTFAIVGFALKYFDTSGKYCSNSSCNNPVYKNGFCIDHYTAEKNNTANSSNVAVSSNDDEKVASEEKDYQTLRMAQIVTTETSEFCVTGCTIDKKIEPDNPQNDYYHYFEANDGNVLVDAQMNIKNLCTEPIAQSEVLSSVSIIYAKMDGNEYRYDCTFVVEDADGDLNEYTSLYSINPLVSMEYHMLAQLPEDNRDGKIFAEIKADGKLYRCLLRDNLN